MIVSLPDAGRSGDDDQHRPRGAVDDEIRAARVLRDVDQLLRRRIQGRLRGRVLRLEQLLAHRGIAVVARSPATTPSRSGGRGASARIRSPVDGEVSSRRQAWRKSRSRPPPRRPGRVLTCRFRRPGRRRPGGRSRRGGHGSGGSARSRDRARGASTRRTARERGSPWSTPGRPVRPPSACGASDRDRSAPRSDPTAAATSPRTRARYVFFTRRALSWAISECCAASCLATISSPLVSRSRRWTIPGLMTPAIPPNSSAPPRASSALTSVSPAWPGEGWTTRPAGLSMMSMSASSWTIRSSISGAGARSSGSASGTTSRSGVPGPITVLALSGNPVRRQVTRRDELLDVAPREPRDVGEEAIDSLRAGIVGNLQDARAGRTGGSSDGRGHAEIRHRRPAGPAPAAFRRATGGSRPG